MHSSETSSHDGNTQYVARLGQTVSAHAADDVAKKLDDIRLFLADDLADVERSLLATGVDGHERQPLALRDTPLRQSASHLLSLSGKRLRPLCVALAARIGGSFTDAARAVAVAVELVHNATLLHDDVVDVSDKRRGSPTARVLYGNAASIFAGDWLLVEALMKLERIGRPDLMGKLLEVLREMLDGEALQLHFRGNLTVTADDYFDIVRGKTASLFRFALYAGARAGDVNERDAKALGVFGEAMGTAFQLTDDLLDLTGQERELGKNLYADLHEGKFTYPLLLAMQRDPRVHEALAAMIAAEGSPEALKSSETIVSHALTQTGALEDAKARANQLSTEALSALATVPAGAARDALEHVAVALVHRNH